MPDQMPPNREPIWTRPVRGARGPSPEHSRGQIARAAMDLADAGGLSAVTMRAVAEALGTRGASLYRYVDSRDELVELMVDEPLGELRLRVDPGQSWQDQLVAGAREQLRVYQRHPWLVAAGLRPQALGPNALRFFDHCLAVTSDLPDSTTARMETLAMITGVVTLFARTESSRTVDPARIFAAAEARTHPHLMKALTQPVGPIAGSPSGPDLFERTIRSLLLGLLPGS